MGDIFLKLLNMSITASWLILAVLCFRLLFSKVPKWIHCLLWWVVAIRLLCPFSPESTFGLLSHTEPIKSSAVVAGEVKAYIPSVNSEWAIVENAVNPMLAESFAYEESESAAPLQVLTYIAGMVWLSGLVLLLAGAVISFARLRILVRAGVPYRNNILICDEVTSPFVLGLFKPQIYVSSGLNDSEIDYIAAHEQAHLKRKDHLWKPLGYLLLCVYWFNPLCWLAYILLCKDIELACDERVIKDMDLQDRKEYARTLLSCADQRRSVMACPIAFGEVGVKERVKTVLHYKKPAFWIVLLSLAACIVVAVCFLTTSPEVYSIKITVPAESTEYFVYSEEEISPRGNTLEIAAGEGLGAAEVVLEPKEVTEENAYEPAYLTPGLPVKMDVEKGAWFRLGVSVQNSSREDIVVYVEVKNVEVRIADKADNAENVITENKGPDGSTLTFSFISEMRGEEKVWKSYAIDCGYETGHMEFVIPKAMSKPPKLLLHDALSSNLEYYRVISGTYSWSTPVASEISDHSSVNHEQQMNTTEASGAAPAIQVKMEGPDDWLKLPAYNGMDSVPYSAGFEVRPDHLVVKEYDLLDLGRIDPELIRETTYEESHFLNLEPRRIYEVKAVWEKENLGVNGFYGEAYYAFATSDVRAESALAETPADDNLVPDIDAVESIVVTNGNTGETLTFYKTSPADVFEELLARYLKLDFGADYEENTRVGYRYFMKLLDKDGKMIQQVTPYKDGFTIGRKFYKYEGPAGLDEPSVELMNYIDLLFYPAA